MRRWKTAAVLSALVSCVVAFRSVVSSAANADWKTYQKFCTPGPQDAVCIHPGFAGFELRYPPDRVPHEGWAYTYKQVAPQPFHALFDVCFSPLVVKTLDCEFEMYVTDDLKKFDTGLHGEIFLDLPGSVDAPVKPSRVGGLQATERDTQAGNGILKNVFITQGQLIYLFVVRGVTPEKLARFQTMLESFRFQPQDAFLRTEAHVASRAR